MRITLGNAIETFLRFDADPFLWISYDPPPDQSSTVMRFVHGAERCVDHIDLDQRPKSKLIEYLKTTVGGATLAELVVFLKLENMNTILELIDRNIKLREEKGERIQEGQAAEEKFEYSNPSSKRKRMECNQIGHRQGSKRTKKLPVRQRC